MGLRDRTDALRIALLLAIVLLHIALVRLLIAYTKFEINKPGTRYSALVLLQPFPKRESPPPTPTSKSAAPHPSHPLEPNSMHEREAPEPNNAITLPNVDWASEAQTGAARSIQEKEAERNRRNLSGPPESDLANARGNASIRPHHGDVENAAGGEAITWLNDKCFWTTRGIGFDGTPQVAKVCKDPPKRETELFKDLKKKLDESDSQRLP